MIFWWTPNKLFKDYALNNAHKWSYLGCHDKRNTLLHCFHGDFFTFLSHKNVTLPLQCCHASAEQCQCPSTLWDSWLTPEPGFLKFPPEVSYISFPLSIYERRTSESSDMAQWARVLHLGLSCAYSLAKSRVKQWLEAVSRTSLEFSQMMSQAVSVASI